MKVTTSKTVYGVKVFGEVSFTMMIMNEGLHPSLLSLPTPF